MLDTLDTDKDGIPDCKDWEIHTPAGHRVNYGGIDMEAPEIDLTSQDPYMDSVVASAHGVDTRSYNMSDAIHLQYKATELRPANRPDSKFLSISGTSDIKPGLEISDENKLRHGAFTKSLLMVYKENPPSLKISSLLQKVDNLMKTQGYYQGMGSTCDKSRMEGNLTGLPPLNFTAKPTATIIRNMGSQVVLNRGSNANLCRGNIFSVQTGSPAKIQVVKVFSDSSIARVLSGSIKAGSSVTLTDNYTITEPLVNLYISKPRYSPTAFDIFFSSSVMPMVQLPQYRDYNNWKNREEALEVYLNEPGSNMEYAEKIKRENFPFYVFLPMPSTIYDAIKKQLSYNQNLRLVDKEEKADFVMYVNYIKEQPDTKSGFSFYFHPRMANKKAYGDRIFSEEHETVSTMPNTHLAAELLAKKIAILGAEMVRIVSNDWQNISPKR